MYLRLQIIADRILKLYAGLITTCIPGQKLLCWDLISTFNENDLSGKDMFTKRLKVIKLMGMVMVALMAVSFVDRLNTSPIDDNVVIENQGFRCEECRVE